MSRMSGDSSVSHFPITKTKHWTPQFKGERLFRSRVQSLVACSKVEEPGGGSCSGHGAQEAVRGVWRRPEATSSAGHASLQLSSASPTIPHL